MIMISSYPHQVYLSRKTSLASIGLSLEQVLAHPIGHQQFKQHGATESSTSNLMFWTRMQHWKEEYKETSDEIRTKVADNMCHKLLPSESEVEVAVGQEVRNRLLETTQKTTKYPFNLLDEVYAFMDSDSFYRFKNGLLPSLHSTLWHARCSS